MIFSSNFFLSPIPRFLLAVPFVWHRMSFCCRRFYNFSFLFYYFAEIYPKRYIFSCVLRPCRVFLDVNEEFRNIFLWRTWFFPISVSFAPSHTHIVLFHSFFVTLRRIEIFIIIIIILPCCHQIYFIFFFPSFDTVREINFFEDAWNEATRNAAEVRRNSVGAVSRAEDRYGNHHLNL